MKSSPEEIIVNLFMNGSQIRCAFCCTCSTYKL